MDYLLIGHICCDITPGGMRLGGTVSFSGLVARKLGWNPAIITSAASDILSLLTPLSGIPVWMCESRHTTTFENLTFDGQRHQILHHHASPLNPDQLTGRGHPEIVHFAPIANEIPIDLLSYFPDSLRCATPQGWLRKWDHEGRVSIRHWDEAEKALAQLDAVVLSIEDLNWDEELAEHYAAMTPLFIVTRGRAGCTLYHEGKAENIPTHVVVEVDSTGAGDIFATAFFSEFYKLKNPYAAVKFALFLATESVQYSGMVKEESLIKAREVLDGS